MNEVKGIPYGVSRFEQVRGENLYYVDKTMYLPLLEEVNNYLFLIRPRRFGKSVFVSMMQDYYDIAKADKFDTLFGDLWIKKHPTKLKNSFQIVYFDFSKANLGMGTLEENFNNYCSGVLNGFIERYRSSYSEQTYQLFMSTSDASVKLHAIDVEAHEKGYPLYLIVDEYDNFTNVILSEGGKQVFQSLTHASGFYREYFKTFKAMFTRVFLIGVSPVTLDDLSSGYNIDWNISQDPRFNYMLGFSESEVRTMFQYYKSHGKLPADADVDAMIGAMRPWYNNYCFAEDCMNGERLFNCDMTFYYLRYQVSFGRPPKEMVDKNIRTDYKKLKMLADLDRGNCRDDRMSVIEKVASDGYIDIQLSTSFPAEHITDDNNFPSLLYYYGLLTMESVRGPWIRMVIPNLCVKIQYWSFLREYYGTFAKVDIMGLERDMMDMSYDGDWRPFIERVANAYYENSSVRDSILGEHNLQGFFKAYFALNSLYLVEPEIELNYGYGDFMLLPDSKCYEGTAHSYIIEMKYVKPTATEAELETKSVEADNQLLKYSQDKMVCRLSEGTTLHLVKIIFRGAKMAICKEL